MVNVTYPEAYLVHDYNTLQVTNGFAMTTSSKHLLDVYVLTLSNLIFLPAIVLAFRRHFIIFAFTLIYTFLFSTMFHACMESNVHYFCILSPDVLTFCNSFGFIQSIFTIQLTMARIPSVMRFRQLTVGAMMIATMQTINSSHFVRHVIPAFVAGVMLIGSWISEMRKRKELFPSKMRYCCFLLPGLATVALGLVVHFLFKDQPAIYPYSHSFWHVAFGTSVCLLMPPRSKEIGCDLSKFANLGVHGESSKETSRSLSGDENAGLDVDEANLITDDDRVILV